MDRWLGPKLAAILILFLLADPLTTWAVEHTGPYFTREVQICTLSGGERPPRLFCGIS